MLVIIIYQSGHVAITFHAITEMSFITTPNQTILNIRTRYKFFMENTDLHSKKKSNLEVPCKRNLLSYWNSCKRLPNFVNVAALILIIRPHLTGAFGSGELKK